MLRESGALNSATTEQLGWTLFHFMWQAALLAGVLAVARIATKNTSSSSRYLCGCVTLLLMATSPVLTFWFYSGSFDVLGPLRLSGSQVQSAAPTLLLIRPFLLWIAVGWFAGVVLLLLLRFGGIILLKWTFRVDTTPVGNPRLHALPRRLGIRRRVDFIQSFAVTAPATLGVLRPVVLVPPGALTGLKPQYLDALVLHELAHVRRQDFIVNVLQTVLETLFFCNCLPPSAGPVVHDELLGRVVDAQAALVGGA